MLFHGKSRVCIAHSLLDFEGGKRTEDLGKGHFLRFLPGVTEKINTKLVRYLLVQT